MTLIVNLSTTHDYSINETVVAFVRLCNEYSKDGLQSIMPGFFQGLTNYAWVMAQYQLNYTSLIEPYRLGKISTSMFLDNLAKIFYFMNEVDPVNRDWLLANAWNASIKLSEKTQNRLSKLVEDAKIQPVYLISNTNELNINAILALFKENNPDIQFNEVDTNIKESKEPIEILPNVYLCLSYRFGCFKEETVSTVSLIDELTKNLSDSIILVSQYPGDIKKAEQLGLITVNADEFYNSISSDSLLIKKNQ